MNRGLKENTYQEMLNVGNAATIYVNVNGNDSNVVIKIPLLETTGKNTMSLSLYYNYQDRNITDLFGKGFKLNYYSKIIEYVSRFFLKKYHENAKDASLEIDEDKRFIVRFASDAFEILGLI